MFQHHPLDVRPCGQQQVVLHGVKGLERIPAARHQLLQPARRGLEHVLLPPGEEVRMEAPVQDVGVLVGARHQVGDPLRQRPGRGQLQDGPHHLVGHEADGRGRIHALELIPEVGEQSLGDQLEQHRVVPLEGREDVGVGPQLGEPVDRQVAGSPAGLPAGLDGLSRVPGRDRLDACRQGLELPLLPRIGIGIVRDLVQ